MAELLSFTAKETALATGSALQTTPGITVISDPNDPACGHVTAHLVGHLESDKSKAFFGSWVASFVYDGTTLELAQLETLKPFWAHADIIAAGGFAFEPIPVVKTVDGLPGLAMEFQASAGLAALDDLDLDSVYYIERAGGGS